ncbi:MAG: hypothetical protein RJA98_2257 [Pseudomonadota bacterium]|jgi:AraC-like DNA-binding protein
MREHLPRLAPPFPAAAELRRYRGEHGAHDHAHAQVLFGVSGCLEVEVNGQLMCVDASAGLIVPAGASHGSASRHGADVWVIDAPPEPALDRVRPFALGATGAQGLPVAAGLAWAREAPRTLPRRRIDGSSLERTVAAALHEGWPTSRLAAHFALSVPQFHARWVALTGRTPQAWLRDQRLDAAERLLRAGWSGDAAAAQVGYASASALLYALRRERQLGARELRHH